MGLAKAFGHLRFVVQDRGVVVDMGVKVRSFFVPFILLPSFFFASLDMLFVCLHILLFFFFLSGHGYIRDGRLILFFLFFSLGE
jgi:hypothetical protein